jgi:hypothetical protein
MRFLENTFLFRLFRKDKILFALIALYMTGILYYSLRQREEFPFLLYGMYSLKEEPKETYTTYSVEVSEQEIKYGKLRDAQRELITSTLENGMPLIAASKLSSSDEAKFKEWLMKYCLDMRLAGDNRMNVYKLSCNYDSAGQVKILKKELVYTYVAK